MLMATIEAMVLMLMVTIALDRMPTLMITTLTVRHLTPTDMVTTALTITQAVLTHQAGTHLLITTPTILTGALTTIWIINALAKLDDYRKADWSDLIDCPDLVLSQTNQLLSL